MPCLDAWAVRAFVPSGAWTGAGSGRVSVWAGLERVQVSDRPQHPAVVAGLGAWWSDVPDDLAAVDLTLDLVLMDKGVVLSAEQGHLVDVGATATGPPLQVVRVAPLR